MTTLVTGATGLVGSHVTRMRARGAQRLLHIAGMRTAAGTVRSSAP